MLCAKCTEAGRGRQEMELMKSFGRDHHWDCGICNHTVIVADRLSKADQENFPTDAES